MSPVPHVDQVHWPTARDEEQSVDANVVAVAGKSRCQALGGDCDAAQAVLVERHRGGFLGRTLFDLNERHCAPAARDKIDLAAGHAGAARKDSPAVEAQPPGSERFRAPSARFSNAAFQAPSPSANARA